MVRISKVRCSSQSLKIVCILANSEDPDEMLCSAVFLLGLHCLPKCLLYKGLKKVHHIGNIFQII